MIRDEMAVCALCQKPVGEEVRVHGQFFHDACVWALVEKRLRKHKQKDDKYSGMAKAIYVAAVAHALLAVEAIEEETKTKLKRKRLTLAERQKCVKVKRPGLFFHTEAKDPRIKNLQIWCDTCVAPDEPNRLSRLHTLALLFLLTDAAIPPAFGCHTLEREYYLVASQAIAVRAWAETVALQYLEDCFTLILTKQFPVECLVESPQRDVHLTDVEVYQAVCILRDVDLASGSACQGYEILTEVASGRLRVIGLSVMWMFGLYLAILQDGGTQALTQVSGMPRKFATILSSIGAALEQLWEQRQAAPGVVVAILHGLKVLRMYLCAMGCQQAANGRKDFGYYYCVDKLLALEPRLAEKDFVINAKKLGLAIAVDTPKILLETSCPAPTTGGDWDSMCMCVPDGPSRQLAKKIASGKRPTLSSILDQQPPPPMQSEGEEEGD